MSDWSERLESIFLGSVEIPSATDRQAFIEQQCAGDAQLRRRVEQLVRDYFQAGSFLESPALAIEATAVSAVEDAVGSSIGDYRIREQIGEGGMGLVYIAEQEQPVRRFVALKVIKPGMDSREIVARFSAERQALALMEHPHIAKVYDAGTTAAGRPYFVMELVRGIPITEYCDQRKLTTRERLQLFVKVCHAIQHAHLKGIIHRDIKPSNILVTMHDHLPVPKVIDFGIAKAVSQSLTDATVYTRFTQLLGTPLYMSPEQAEMNALDVDTRSDVYSLGALLYELLTGHTPFDCEKIHKVGLDEVRRMIRENEPLRPSRRFSTLDAQAASTVSQARGVDQRRLTHVLRGELDWIVMKTLEKDRTQRYESASALAADVQRYLDDQPVEACPPTTIYRLRKFARRHKVALTTFSAVAVALLAGTALSAWQAMEARAARQTADQQRQRVDAHFELAHEAVFDLVTRMAVAPQLRKSDFHSLRKELLTRAASFYDRLAEQRQDDATLQLEQAGAHLLLAQLQSEMGDHPAARKSNERSLAIVTQLASQNPLYRQQLALQHSEMGIRYLNLRLRTEALDHFEKSNAILSLLADEQPDRAPEIRTKLANNYTNMGVIFSQLGKVPEAKDAYENAFELQLDLAQQFPDQPERLLVLASARDNLSQLLMNVGDYQQAEQECRQALKLWEDLTAKFPSSTDVQINKAVSHVLHGRILRALQKDSDAEADFISAEQLTKSLSTSFPMVPDYRRLQAQTVFNLADIYQQRGDHSAAEAKLRHVANLFESLSKNFPLDPNDREGLADTHNLLAVVLTAQDRFMEAESHYRTGLAFGQALVTDFPQVVDYAKRFSVRCYNFGLVLRDQDKPSEALEWLTKSIETFSTAFEDEPGTKQLRLRDGHWARAQLLMTLERYADALIDWDRAIEFDSGDEKLFLRAQRMLCQLRVDTILAEQDLQQIAHEVSAANTKVDPATFYDLACAFSLIAAQKADSTERETAAIQALEFLRQAKSAGFFSSAQELNQLRDDADLTTIRDRADFQQFVDEVAADLSTKG